MYSIEVAVLTVSDRASLDSSADVSGPTIQTILNEQQGKFKCAHRQIVPDDIVPIQGAVKRWSQQEDIDWIITTGGTGFGVRDLTPEAIKPLLEREAPGLVHLLLSTSLNHTPLAALSRPVAGTIGRTLIVTLPGSVKAVKENLQALLNAGLVEHAIDLIKGGEGRRVHAQLAEASGEAPRPAASHHHHDHHHHHGYVHHAPQPRTTLSHDPSASVSARHRQSPYPLVSLQEALRFIESNVQPLAITTCRVDPTLKGHVLASDIYAPNNVPPCPTTNVDGYALRSTDPPGVYKVLTSQTHSLSHPIPSGSVYRINTGGPLPAGADAVIMVEDTRLVAIYEDPGSPLDGEEKEIETLAQVFAGENIRAPGSDVREGDLVLQKGEVIRSSGGEVGTLAFVGRKEVEVYKKPVVALLSTGNEIIDLQSAKSHSGDEWGVIFDTNRPSLQAALEGMGYQVVDLGIVPDNVDAHVAAIKRGVETADILLTTGGTSMGPTDLLKPVIERHFNGTIHFGRVTIKPGKPTTFATIPFQNGVSKPMFALPGNPASALVTFHVFVVPALRLLGGWPQTSIHLPRVRVELQSEMYLDPRTEFHRVIIRAAPDGLKAFSTGNQRSSRVASLSGANGFVILPPKTADTVKLEIGNHVDAVLIGELESGLVHAHPARCRDNRDRGTAQRWTKLNTVACTTAFPQWLRDLWILILYHIYILALSIGPGRVPIVKLTWRTVLSSTAVP
ncbi:putative molybdenum cofactor biosynthesis protein [Lyophyllum shimeji]|uniref:Molybdenum cofactor biosynthesis protein n=1 Tax=Lyophyllum shimeji TaxID=47721 RepID=A0A9P3UIH2_LYOSH|nr:putative molybdenum cofactor biosynthesis protein [Lyophyllum shimeji]